MVMDSFWQSLFLNLKIFNVLRLHRPNRIYLGILKWFWLSQTVGDELFKIWYHFTTKLFTFFAKGSTLSGTILTQIAEIIRIFTREHPFLTKHCLFWRSRRRFFLRSALRFCFCYQRQLFIILILLINLSTYTQLIVYKAELIGTPGSFHSQQVWIKLADIFASLSVCILRFQWFHAWLSQTLTKILYS